MYQLNELYNVVRAQKNKILLGTPNFEGTQDKRQVDLATALVLVDLKSVCLQCVC